MNPWKLFGIIGWMVMTLSLCLVGAQDARQVDKDISVRSMDSRLSPEDLEKLLAEIQKNYSNIPGGCFDNVKIQAQLREIGTKIDAYIRANNTEEGKRFLSIKVAEFKREINNIKRIDTRLRQVKKRIEIFNRQLKNANETDFQKLESVRNRLTSLYEKALSKRNSCDIKEAATLLREVEKMGDKVRHDIKKNENQEERAKNALKHGEEILNKIKSRASGEKQREKIARAEELLQKARTAYQEGKYQRTINAVGTIKKVAHKIEKQGDKAKREENVKDRYEDLKKRTEANYQKADANLKKAEEQGRKALERAKKEIEKAEKMEKQGKYGRSIEHLKRANKLSRKVSKRSRIKKDINRTIIKLERRMARAENIIRESGSKDAMTALEEARNHLNKAKEFSGSGKNGKAAQEAKLTVRLLGKAIHLTDRNKLANNPKVLEEVQKTREEILNRLHNIRESDNPEAKRMARQAMKHLSRAKNLARKSQNKRALKQLFKAGEITERALHKLERGNSRIDKKED